MSRGAVDVRRAGPADLDALLELVAGLRAEVDEGAQEGSRERLLAVLDRPDLDVLVAWAGARPVGLAVVRRGPLVPLLGDDALHVEHLAVHAPWRRRGVAGQLLAAVAAAAETAGCRDVTCATPAGHREANRFLARLGFAPAVTHRVTPAAALRRQLARRGGHEPRAVQQLLVRRRVQRGRVAALRAGAAVGDARD